jgi:hypothetical protein
MIGKHFMEMFWEAKENARKYTPVKYRSDDGADHADGKAGPGAGPV